MLNATNINTYTIVIVYNNANAMHDDNYYAYIICIYILYLYIYLLYIYIYIYNIIYNIINIYMNAHVYTVEFAWYNDIVLSLL